MPKFKIKKRKLKKIKQFLFGITLVSCLSYITYLYISSDFRPFHLHAKHPECFQIKVINYSGVKKLIALKGYTQCLETRPSEGIFLIECYAPTKRKWAFAKSYAQCRELRTLISIDQLSSLFN